MSKAKPNKIAQLLEYMDAKGDIGEAVFMNEFLKQHFAPKDLNDKNEVQDKRLAIMGFLSFLDQEGLIVAPNVYADHWSDTQFISSDYEMLVLPTPKGLNYLYEYRRQVATENNNRAQKWLSILTLVVAGVAALAAIAPLIKQDISTEQQAINTATQTRLSTIEKSVQRQQHQNLPQKQTAN